MHAECWSRTLVAHHLRSTTLGFWIATSVGLTSMQAAAAGPDGLLLAIDQNRAALVDRIVGERGDAMLQSGAGITSDQLRAMLMQLRADQLLAASMAGTPDGVRDVIARSLVGTDPINPALLHPVSSLSEGATLTKAIGDTGDDVVYTPVTPCRLVETRGTFPAVYQGNGTPAHTADPFSANEIRTYTIQGGNSVCTSQLPSGLGAAAVQLQVFGIPTTTASGDIEILPQGSTFGSTATEVYIGSIAFNTVSTTAKINTTNNEISVQVRGGKANLAMDVVGYFRTPGNYENNLASGAFATVSGGIDNSATGNASAVSGGFLNSSSGSDSVVSGETKTWLPESSVRWWEAFPTLPPALRAWSLAAKTTLPPARRAWCLAARTTLPPGNSVSLLDSKPWPIKHFAPCSTCGTPQVP